MDTWTAEEKEAQAQRVAEGLALIKARMPKVYAHIQEKAGEIGNLAYALVRRGLSGQANCFYAFERGHVVGTPFSAGPLPDAVAAQMVQFDMAFVALWAKPAEVEEAKRGAN